MHWILSLSREESSEFPRVVTEESKGVIVTAPSIPKLKVLLLDKCVTDISRTSLHYNAWLTSSRRQIHKQKWTSQRNNCHSPKSRYICLVRWLGLFLPRHPCKTDWDLWANNVLLLSNLKTKIKNLKVSPMDGDVIISIWSRLFMLHAKCVQQFMYYNTHVDASTLFKPNLSKNHEDYKMVCIKNYIRCTSIRPRPGLYGIWA